MNTYEPIKHKYCYKQLTLFRWKIINWPKWKTVTLPPGPTQQRDCGILFSISVSSKNVEVKISNIAICVFSTNVKGLYNLSKVLRCLDSPCPLMWILELFSNWKADTILRFGFLPRVFKHSSINISAPYDFWTEAKVLQPKL